MQKIQYHFIIPETLHDKRFDQAVAQLATEFSRSQLKTWIISGNITLDGNIARPRDKVRSGQQIGIDAEMHNDNNWHGEDLPLDIIYEDEHIIVINKPAGVVVHPGAGNTHGTLVNALVHHAPVMKDLPRCGIVHRLDKNTSGLLVAVKTAKAHQSIIKQLQTHEMGREYEAICKGVLISGDSIEEPIGRHPKSRIKMAVHPNGKEAITHYRIIERFREHTHVRVQLETGRTHQIRVHFDHKLFPLLGDPVYGTYKKPAKKGSEDYQSAIQAFRRQALHAAKLTLTHPESHELMSWGTPLPDDMQQLLTALRHDNESH